MGCCGTLAMGTLDRVLRRWPKTGSSRPIGLSRFYQARCFLSNQQLGRRAGWFLTLGEVDTLTRRASEREVVTRVSLACAGLVWSHYCKKRTSPGTGYATGVQGNSSTPIGDSGCAAKKPRGLRAARGALKKIRQHLLSHFGYYHRPWKLNGRVRNGNGCGLPGMVTGRRPAAR